MKRDLDFATGTPTLGAVLRSPSVWLVLAAAAAIIVAYWTTAASIVAIWIRSETFAHGFVIVPICAWLAWRKRSALATIALRPWWPGTLFVLLAGSLWFAGAKANAEVVQQFALAFMLQAACVTIIGLAAARHLAFALAFLLFAVPAGEFLVPTLMNWTADFTVAALRATGVPVYREANHFVIPSGAWSVVEACSGIRYIIASLMVGTIYAAIAYRGAGRRALFIAASIVVPIVANWLRAYIIVLLGHLTSNRIATGIDHVIYGWVFFGLVMLLLFWVGSFWQEARVANERALEWPSARAGIVLVAPLSIAAVLAVAAAVVWRPVDAIVGQSPAPGRPILTRIEGGGRWSPAPADGVGWAPYYEGYSADMRETFSDGDSKVGVYVAYYRSQGKGHQLITSGNALTEAKDWRWKQVDPGTDEVTWDRRAVTSDRADLVGERVRLRVLSLYWIAGSVTSSAYVAKALQAWSKISGRGDDAALVVIYTPVASSSEAATRTLKQFAASVSPSIEATLRRAQESGR